MALPYPSAGFRGIPNGIHSGVDPMYVPDGSLAAAVNADFRKGVAQTRPDFNRVRNFVLPTAYRKGRFQGAIAHRYGGRPRIMFGVSGELFSFDIDLGELVRITEDVPRFSKDVARLSFVEAGPYIIVQDGINTPVIVEGSSGRVSQPSKPSPVLDLPGEVGTGTHMAYLYGRLVLGMTNSADFLVGDPIIPITYPDNFLYFAENQYLQGAGAFQTLDQITALAPWAQLDTPTGIGGLLVMTEDTTEAYDIATDRRIWGFQPISRVILNRGAVGPQAVVSMNNDVYFRNQEGIFSIRSARGEATAGVFLSYSRTNEMFLRHDDPTALKLCSGAVFDKRVLFTCAPYNHIREEDNTIETTFRGLVVFDHDVDAAPRSATEIASGMWTGLDFFQVFTLRDRTWAFQRTPTGDIDLWEFGGDTGWDNGETPIEMALWTPAYDFGNRIERKKLDKTQIWANAVQGQATFAMDFRADRREWVSAGAPVIRTWENETCNSYTPPVRCEIPATPSCALPALMPGSELALTFPDKSVDFHALEIKITVTGKAEIHLLRVVAPAKADESRFVADRTSRLEQCPQNLFTYRVQP